MYAIQRIRKKRKAVKCTWKDYIVTLWRPYKPYSDWIYTTDAWLKTEASGTKQMTSAIIKYCGLVPQSSVERKIFPKMWWVNWMSQSLLRTKYILYVIHKHFDDLWRVKQIMLLKYGMFSWHEKKSFIRMKQEGKTW